MNIDTTGIPRDKYLQTTDSELSAICHITCAMGSGPGGQKRNKTATAVKAVLPELGLSAADCTERSQFRNRANALKKLRMQIALKFRVFPALPPNPMECSMNSPAYALFAAHLLDVLAENSFDHKQAANICGISPSALLKKLYRDQDLWNFFQNNRKELALPSLHPPK